MEFLAGAALVAPQRPQGSRFVTVGENGTNVRFVSARRDPNAPREWESSPEKYDEHIESLREKEFPQLKETTYLDHAGATLPSTSLATTFSKDLSVNLFGNSQTASPSSHLSRKRIKTVRNSVLRFLNADPKHFDVIFTANTAGAIKIVRETFVSSADGFQYVHHRDCHVSLVGLRESATHVVYLESDADVEKWIQEGAVTAENTAALSPLRLFAYPAQSEFSGSRCPLAWTEKIRNAERHEINGTDGPARPSTANSKRYRQRGVYTFVDVSSFLQTSPIQLGDPAMSPDYMCLSFDRIFGFPNLGALIVNKTTGASELIAEMKIRKGSTANYFGNGIIETMITSKHNSQNWYAVKSQISSPTILHEGCISTSTGDIHQLCEDGSLPVHSLVALQHAFDYHTELFGRPESLRNHTSRLIKTLTDDLSSMRHVNGRRAVQIYKDAASTFDDANTQGPIVAFSIISANGSHIGKTEVERAAIATGIQLQTGDFSVPGAVATHLGLEPWEIRRNYVERQRRDGTSTGAAEHEWDEGIDIVGGKATGVVRISLGAMSCMKDIQKVTRWVRWWFVGPEIPEQGAMASGSYDVGKGLSLNLGTMFEGSMDESHANVKEQERTDGLIVIEGLEAVEILRRRISGGAAGMQRRKTTREAIKVWEKEWVVVSLEESSEGLPVPMEILAKAKLKPKILPEEGVMVVERERGLLDRVAKDERKVEINLWAIPPQSQRTEATILNTEGGKHMRYGTDANRDGAPKTADRYYGDHIRKFFSAAVGIPCTLARYRSRYLSSKQWRCVKVGCGCIEETGDDLWSHYEQHVEELHQWEMEIEEREKLKEVEDKKSEDKMRLSIPGRRAQSFQSQATSEKRSRSRSRVVTSRAREKADEFRNRFNISTTNLSLPSISLRGRDSARNSSRPSLTETGATSIREESSVHEADDGKSLCSAKVEEEKDGPDPMPDEKEVKMKIEQQMHRAFSNPGSTLSTTVVGDRNSYVSAKEDVLPEKPMALPPPPPPPPPPPASTPTAETDSQSQHSQDKQRKLLDKKIAWKGYAMVMRAKLDRSTNSFPSLTGKKSKTLNRSGGRDPEKEGLVEMDGTSFRSWSTRGRGRGREREREDVVCNVPEGVVEMEA